MTKTVKVSFTIPEDLIQSVKEYAGDKSLSTTVSDLLRIALRGGSIEHSSPVLQDDTVIQRLESLEVQYNDEMAQLRNEMRELKVKTLLLETKVDPKKKSAKRLNYGFIPITSEMRTQMSDRFELMQTSGLTQAQISPILGLKNDSIVSKIRNERQKSISQKGFDALMAWTP